MNNYNIIKNNYKIIKLIGKGAFGEVYKGINLKKHNLVAIKRIKKTDGNFMNEIKICQYLSDIAGIYKLRWYGSDYIYNYVIFDLLGSNLLTYLNQFERFKLSTIKTISKQILLILNHIHKRNIVHRDIKLDNFVMGTNNSQKIYLIDFGIATVLKQKKINIKSSNNIVGSLNYMSLNIHKGEKYNKIDDIISFFYVIVHMYYGKLPWLLTNKVKDIIQLKTNLTINNILIDRIFTNINTLTFENSKDYTILFNSINKLSIYEYLEWNEKYINLSSN